MAYNDPDVRRTRDRERFRKRTVERIVQGLCPRCGKRPPALGRSVCEPCGEKRNRAGRARDAKLRVAGRPRRDPEKARFYERERSRRQAAERFARGLCSKCGQTPSEPNRRLCGPCAGKRREAERMRYAKAMADGKLYGGRDPGAKRRSARATSRKRRQARREAGLCGRCGRRPPVEGGTTCGPCRRERRTAERQRYEERRAAGLCGRCGGPTTDGGSRCAPCAMIEAERGSPERKNAAARRRYAARRAANACTDCNSPSQGAARCEECARRSYERSDHFRGIPVWEPSYVVIETGASHGPFDCEADVALCLAFAKLNRDEVEIVGDVSPMARLTAWE